MDSSDVSNYLKAIIITPKLDDFAMAESFRHGLSDEELKKGICAYHEFLCKFYDKLAADKDRFVTRKSQQYYPDAIIKTHFPIVDDILRVLFLLGLNGKLEVGVANRLNCGKAVFDGSTFTQKHKLELLNYLFELDIYFDGIDLSGETDADIGAFSVEYNDSSLIVGLKLMAHAQTNIKNLDLAAVMMRGDYRPLANATPKKQVIHVSDYTNACLPYIGDWLISLDRYLSNNGCSVTAKGMKILYRGNGCFEYISRKTKLKVCLIDIRIGGSKITLYGNHFAEPNSIIDKLPDNMLNVLKYNKGCRPCGGPEKCGFGNKYYRFTHENHEYTCCIGGFCFNLNENIDLLLLEKWIEKEISWHKNASPEDIAVNTINREELTRHENRWINRNTSSKDKGTISIFEQTNRQQNLIRPPIEDCVKYFIKNDIQKAVMEKLIKMVRQMGMEPRWKSKNRYDCAYKTNKEMVIFRIEGENDFVVSIAAFSWRERTMDFFDFVHSLPDDKKHRIITINELLCSKCDDNTCGICVKLELQGKEHMLCSKKSYVCESPEDKHLETIEWLINLGMDYIDFKISKKNK